MRVTKTDGSPSRLVLTGMIASDQVLSQIAPRWPRTGDGLFDADSANYVARWCVDYYEKYNKAPGKTIKHLFNAWRNNGVDQKALPDIERLLAELSREYEAKGLNDGYVVDAAGKLFNGVKLTRLKDAIESALEVGYVEDADKMIREYTPVDIGVGAGVGLIREPDAVQAAFAAKVGPMIRFKGALGNFFGSDLSRDSFVSFEAPPKRAKTTWLMEIAWQAVLQGLRVAFFEVGDLSQNQVIRRFAARAAKHPLSPGTLRWPTDIRPPTHNRGTCEVDFKDYEFAEGLSAETAVEALGRVAERFGGDGCRLRLFTYPNCTISMAGIKSVLKGLERQGWVGDLIVIDYADILAPIDGKVETRDQINANWMLMRQLSESLHCLVVTATQTNASSYDAETIGMSHFSGDNRKRAHVTASVGIDQNDDEKKEQLFRLNWIVRREDDFDRKRCVYTAACMGIYHPAVQSTF